ncbi:hypothetical protein WICMUC_001555 [Wickerhamomyces mucosus]|uniref:Uncharacterized protein n=1 Tax=Wickerhamomyces mucosus TaxID=1378264 RepID=A0A9P8PUD6_9ASCO|nr:hypothetical protein WICMUC_001555 [Wickerhamomyces mucosus]
MSFASGEPKLVNSDSFRACDTTVRTKLTLAGLGLHEYLISGNVPQFEGQSPEDVSMLHMNLNNVVHFVVFSGLSVELQQVYLSSNVTGRGLYARLLDDYKDTSAKGVYKLFYDSLLAKKEGLSDMSKVAQESAKSMQTLLTEIMYKIPGFPKQLSVPLFLISLQKIGASDSDINAIISAYHQENGPGLEN